MMQCPYQQDTVICQWNWTKACSIWNKTQTVQRRQFFSEQSFENNMNKSCRCIQTTFLFPEIQENQRHLQSYTTVLQWLKANLLYFNLMQALWVILMPCGQLFLNILIRWLRGKNTTCLWTERLKMHVLPRVSIGSSCVVVFWLCSSCSRQSAAHVSEVSFLCSAAVSPSPLWTESVLTRAAHISEMKLNEIHFLISKIAFHFVIDFVFTNSKTSLIQRRRAAYSH